MEHKITLIEFLKKFTAIPEKFINEYSKFYDMCNSNKFGIKITDIMEYFKITNRNKFEERIRNNYKKNLDYEVLEINQKSQKGIKDVEYMISFDGFEKIAMKSNTKKGQMFRDYFIMLRKFIDYYKQHFANKIMNLTTTNKFIYILLVNKNKQIFKLGRTIDMRKRLQAYATGKENHPDVKFIMIVNDDKKVENCSKMFLKVKQFKSNKELYKINLDYLKHTIYTCAKLDDELIKQIENTTKYDSYIIFDDSTKLDYISLDDNKINKTIKQSIKKHQINTLHKTKKITMANKII
jgi:phage anti-repressor protein